MIIIIIITTSSTRIRIDDQRKDHIYPGGPPQGNSLKQLHTHNLPTDDVNNINSSNKDIDLLFSNKPRIVP